MQSLVLSWKQLCIYNGTTKALNESISLVKIGICTKVLMCVT